MAGCFDYDCDLCNTHHEVQKCPLQPFLKKTHNDNCINILSLSKL